MKKLYLNYKYASDEHTTNRYSPKLAFERMFSFYFKVGAIKMVDEILSDWQMKAFTINWVDAISDERLAYIEYDEVVLTALWKTVDTLITKIANPWVWFDMEAMTTNAEVITWIQTYTNLVEKTPWVFILAEANTEVWFESEELLLTV